MKPSPFPPRPAPRRRAAAAAALAAALLALPGCDRRPTTPPSPSTVPSGLEVQANLA